MPPLYRPYAAQHLPLRSSKAEEPPLWDLRTRHGRNQLALGHSPSPRAPRHDINLLTPGIRVQISTLQDILVTYGPT